MITRRLTLIALTLTSVGALAQTPATNGLTFTLADDSVITAPKVMRVSGGFVTLKHTRGISTIAISELDEKTRAALNLPDPVAPPLQPPAQPPPAPQLGVTPVIPAPPTTPSRVRCPACNGSGSSQCTTCNGAKYKQVKRLDPCDTCGGDGYVRGHYFRGNYVWGHGCSDCGGKGKRDKGNYDTIYCETCGGHGYATCPTCHGAKTIVQ